MVKKTPIELTNPANFMEKSTALTYPTFLAEFLFHKHGQIIVSSAL